MLAWASRRLGPVAAHAAAGLLVLAGCTGASSSPAATSSPNQPTEGSVVQTVEQLPRVGDIAAAIAAVERQLGMAQEYFEINATPQRVNLFVAMNNATVVQAFAFENGKLTSNAPQSGASGRTFPAAAVQVEGVSVFDTVRSKLPGSLIRALEIVGTLTGTARYSVVVNSNGGEPLVIQVEHDGAIVGTDLQVPGTAAATTP